MSYPLIQHHQLQKQRGSKIGRSLLPQSNNSDIGLDSVQRFLCESQLSLARLMSLYFSIIYFYV